MSDKAKNTVRFGLENLHVAPLKTVEDLVTFEKPIHIPGAVGFNANPDGSNVEFFADNIKYYFREVNNGYTGDIETAYFPDEILALLLGWLIDDNDVLVEIANGKTTPFALMGQFEGDVHGGRFVYYNCIPGRPGQASSTKTQTADPETETMPLEILPIKIENKLLIKAVVEKTSSVYDDFFDEVYIPEDTLEA